MSTTLFVCGLYIWSFRKPYFAFQLCQCSTFYGMSFAAENMSIKGKRTNPCGDLAIWSCFSFVELVDSEIPYHQTSKREFHPCAIESVRKYSVSNVYLYHFISIVLFCTLEYHVQSYVHLPASGCFFTLSTLIRTRFHLSQSTNRFKLWLLVRRVSIYATIVLRCQCGPKKLKLVSWLAVAG